MFRVRDASGSRFWSQLGWIWAAKLRPQSAIPLDTFSSCVQEAAKKRPRGFQERPKSAQERPKSAQERPKSAQERPKIAQERPKIGQERPKSRPRAPKDTPESPLRGSDARNKRLSKASCRATRSRSVSGTIFDRLSKHACKHRTLISKRPYGVFRCFSRIASFSRESVSASEKATKKC